MKVTWFTKLLFKFTPNLAFRRLAGRMGIKNVLFEEARKLFEKTKRIDFFPLENEQRGFVLILDEKTALYFYQDGDHFSYDGFEMGEYNRGDVTIFDNLENTTSHLP